jgi:hypothetical protein
MTGSEAKETALLQTEVEQLLGLAANMKSDLDELERGRVTKEETIPTSHLYITHLLG